MAKKRHPHPHVSFLRGKARVARKKITKLRRVLAITGLCIGLSGIGYVGLLMAGFFAVKLHVTDVAGTVDPNSDAYEQLSRSLLNIPIGQLHLPNVDSKDEETKKLAAAQDNCQIAVVNAVWPLNGTRITAAKTSGVSHEILAKMVFAVRLRDADSTFRAALDACITTPNTPQLAGLTSHTANAFPWVNSEEWGIAQAAFTKDASTVNAAATTTTIEPRMIVAAGFVEQMRLYFTEREVYERFFRPLKVLGSATQFAWGVMAIKEVTAVMVENNLRDPKSLYYLGPEHEAALDFSTPDHNKERFDRLTNEKNHLYSYLYGGFELAQFRAQWRKENFPIDNRPEVLATLYNIGFKHSKPNNNPQVGGSTIHIADTDYTFGALAFEFYYSGEMLDVFPYTATSAQ